MTVIIYNAETKELIASVSGDDIILKDGYEAVVETETHTSD